MMNTTVIADRAKPLGNYPHAKRAGDLVFLSGTTARQPDGTVAGTTRNDDGSVHRDASVQTRVVIQNIAKTLVSLGGSLADCVDMMVFLVDIADFPAFNAVYAEFFDVNGPARTTLAVRSLPHPDMVVEMKAVALIRQQGTS
jgi:2-aminomuconate deaminase